MSDAPSIDPPRVEAGPDESGASGPVSSTDSRGYRVILAAPQWTLNGVNVFNLNLARGLVSRGLEPRILVTEEETELVAPAEPAMRRPPDVAFDSLPVKWWEGWGAHWGATLHYLEARAPCVYVPNYDYRHSCVSPRLPASVSVVGVVHSDDPLHYEHVGRLGRYWDATVCVSARLGERTAALCPEIADRIETIPIGIAIPPERPPREPAEGGVLRMIYHGVLKQHQKRILDLPRVVSALEDRGARVRLSIAGGGPEEEALRKACGPQVERGSVRFLGVVDHDRIPELLRANDVYLLTSEFEGMPNALLEAMANGCVPVVSAMESGIPELVRDGESGLLVPIGDIDAFADRLAELQADPVRRERIASSAYAAVSRGAFSSDDMIDAYVRVFDRVREEALCGTFLRPEGEILPPPAEVGGVGIFRAGGASLEGADVEGPGRGGADLDGTDFEWSLDHHEEGVGSFPTREDARDFARRLAAPDLRARGPIDARRLHVIATAPFWTDNWSNVRCLELLRGLSGLGARVRLLLTEERTSHVTVTEPRLPLPADLAVDYLEVGRSEGWGGHWGATIRYLEAHAPCIYLPTHDWRHAAVLPRLSAGVVAVGTVSGDALHLEQARRLGAFWNAAVATDRAAARELERQAPDLFEHSRVIQPGLDVPDTPPRRRMDPESALRILVFEPETRGFARLGGIRLLESSLKELSVPFELTIVGSDPAHPSTLAQSRGAQSKGARSRGPRFEAPRGSVGEGGLEGDPVETGQSVPVDHLGLLDLFASVDVLLAAPPEGSLPGDLRLAMGRGTILVVCGATPSPLLDDGRNALTVRAAPDAAGWGRATAEHLAALHADSDLRLRLSAASHATVVRMYRVSDMAEAYSGMFEQLLGESRAASYRRPRGEILPPPGEIDGIGVFPVELTYHAEGVGRFPSAADYRRFKGQLGPFQALRSLLDRTRSWIPSGARSGDIESPAAKEPGR